MLAFWVMIWPFLIMAGVTADHPEHATRTVGIITLQAAASLGCICGGFFLVEKRWFWWVASAVALWFPTAVLIMTVL